MDQTKISILDIVSCLSTAMDLINSAMVNHQRRVGYIAQRLAHEAGRPEEEQNNLLVAGFLHDCGALSLEERFMAMRFEGSMQSSTLHLHAEAGFRLLRKFKPFARVAEYIRFHHLPWARGAGQEFNNQPVPLGGHILHLADRVEILIDQQGHILQQAKGIAGKIEQAGSTLFAPELVEVFKSLAAKESFWLDIKSLNCDSPWSGHSALSEHIRLDHETLRELTAIISQIIDFRSRFTATHSSGVAACGVWLARTLGMSPREQVMMQISGNFHDLGKLAVPKEILEKPAGLSEQEFCIVRAHPYYTRNILNKFTGLSTIAAWAAEHHERLDGRGYPYHFQDHELSLGSRILAVADVFTAITEDRPYRLGMEGPQVVRVLNDLAADRALDGDIVTTLTTRFAEINQVRIQAQASTLEEYREFNRPL